MRRKSKRNGAPSATEWFRCWMNGKSARAAEGPVSTDKIRNRAKTGPSPSNAATVETFTASSGWCSASTGTILETGIVPTVGIIPASIRRKAMKVQCRFCGSEYFLQVFIEGRKFPYLDQCHCVFCGRNLKNLEVIHHVERTNKRRTSIYLQYL